MDLPLLLLISLPLSLLCWLFVCFQRMDMPVGISEPWKYKVIHIVVETVFNLGYALENVGICSEIKFVRLLFGLEISRRDQKLRIRNGHFDNVPVRIYEPNHPSTELRRCVIYLHGGVHILGTTSSYAGVCRRLALESRSMVVDVGYRLAPEHPHPTQKEDCMLAVLHFLKEAKDYGVDPNRVIFAGDSSGAALLSAVFQTLVNRRDVPKIQAQVLFYPYLQTIDITLPSYQQNLSVPVMPSERAVRLGLRFMTTETVDFNGIMKNAHVPDEVSVKYRKWISADHIPNEFKARSYVPPVPAPFSEKIYKIFKMSFHMSVSPLIAEDDIVRQLPETFLLTCEYDPLRDDGLLYKKRLEGNGVPVTWLHLKEGFHGIMLQHALMPFQFREAEKAWQHVADFIQRF